MKALRNDDFASYWTETSAAEGLLEFISKDYNGMTKTITELIGGVDVAVSTTGFAKDAPDKSRKHTCKIIEFQSP